MSHTPSANDVNMTAIATILIAGSLFVATIVVGVTGWFWAEVNRGREAKFVQPVVTELGQINARQQLRLTVDAQVPIDQAMRDVVIWHEQHHER